MITHESGEGAAEAAQGAGHTGVPRAEGERPEPALIIIISSSSSSSYYVFD